MKNRHSTVVAYLALFVALGGTSYAAAKIGSAQIKNNSIKSVDVKNRSLLAKDFKPGQLPAGAPGAQGLPGAKGDKGDPGANGTNGTNGTNGADGTAKGYINIPNNAADNTVVNDPPRSKGVIAYEKVFTPAGGGGVPPEHYTYCFDLSFTPEVAVASPFFANNAIIATSVGHDFGTTVAGCPSPLNDAKAVVRDTANGEHGDVRFSIMFN